MKKRLVCLVVCIIICCLALTACFDEGTRGLQYEYKSLQTGPLQGNFSGMYTVTGITTKAKNVVIPDRYKGHGVYAIGESAFENNTYLETIVIPAGCNVAANAFAGCTNLKKVYFGGTQLNMSVNMSIAYGNDCLKNATWYFFAEEKPQDTGNYWHFVDNKPVEW